MSQAHGTSSLAFRLKSGTSPLDEEMEDAPAAGAGIAQQPSSATAASAQAPGAPVVAVWGGMVGKKRLELEDELGDLEDEESQEANLAKDTKKQSKPYLKKAKSVSAKEKESEMILKNWKAGWLQHMDASIRPTDLSRNLVHHVAVLSFFMGLLDTGDALLEQMEGGGRPFEPVDIRKVAESRLGRKWEDLSKEVFGESG